MASDAQKRKRGRPPLSKPGTSAGTSGADYNYVNMFAAVKNQQDQRERIQRENRLQQERQQERRLAILKQQEHERLKEMKLAQERERQRELQLQQERERQRAEMERQRKAQHRMAMADIDRARRQQHMAMVRNLDAYKRNEEREKQMNAMMEERNRQNERRIYQKRLETELIKELRKPVDDMMLKNQKPLATLNRIPGLKLPGKAFADLLMSYEFLFNFGETVGLELRQIPNINTLQLGLMNLEMKAEDQLISIMHHLCMFAIKDPRFPYTGSTKEIENLPRTNEGLSQLLHFYLQVLTLNAKTEMEHESRLYRLIEQKYFLALNATQKAEMLAFICNELLCSQTVTKQVEDTIENVAKLRKDKWVLENELRKFRSVKTKREAKEEAEQRAREAAEEAAAIAEAAANATGSEVTNTNGETDVNNEGNNNDSIEQIKNDLKKDDNDKNKSTLTNGSINEEGSPSKKDLDTSVHHHTTTNDLDDLEPEMSNDELYKKIENLTRQYNKTSNKLERAINSMRANPLGQDRYRRRYWVLPQVGGVFVEGMESSEPEELVNNKFTEEELEEYEKEQQALGELESLPEPSDQPSDETEKVDVDDEKEDEEMEVKEEIDDKDEEEPMDANEEETAESTDTKVEAKSEALENGQSEVEGKTSDVTDSGEPGQDTASKIPWFSILPRPSCDFRSTPKDESAEEEDAEKKALDDETGESKAEMTIEELKDKRHEICPGLAKRLEELEAEQYESPKKIHPQFQYGWWRITDAQQLKSILSVLHERGARERVLQKHLTKYFQYACNSCRNSTVDFEITTYDRQLAGKNYGAPVSQADDDSGDELRDGDEEDEDGADDYEDDIGDEKVNPQATTTAAPPKKSKRKKGSSSVRSRRLRARAAARKKVENSRNKLAQKIN